MWRYPILANLSEEMINGISFLYLPGEYGIYRGLYLCFDENSAIYNLRREGYAVGKIDTYDTVKKLFLECAEYAEKMAEKKKIVINTK